MNIENKVVLITGAARIGHVVAMRLAERGAHVALTFRSSAQAAKKTESAVRAMGRKALAVKSDLSINGSAKSVNKRVKSVFGKLHVLINMASIYESVKLQKVVDEDWEKNIGANLKPAYDMSLEAAPLIKQSGGGRIINVSDWTVESGRPRYKDLVPYYVSKSAVSGLTQVLALELAPSILVNTIAPGPILPPPKMNPSEARQVVQATPLRKWGGAEEIAKAVLFLIESDFVTGEAIRVDGGRHLY
jgi:NAD(P)-dependent dehydrogenase (short-subunit alcohol dehydrogenase family)